MVVSMKDKAACTCMNIHSLGMTIPYHVIACMSSTSRLFMQQPIYKVVLCTFVCSHRKRANHYLWPEWP